MSEKMSEVYSAYDIEVRQTLRGRGSTILVTDKGVYQLKSLDTNESRLNAEYLFKESLYEYGFTSIDRCIKNCDGELVTYDRYNNPFVMRSFFLGKECNATKTDDINDAVDNLARLHIACREVFNSTENDVHIRTNGDFRRRNRELKRVRTFMGRQKLRREFENVYIKAYDYFYEKALRCEEKFTPYFSMDRGEHLGYCHGTYNHHSILIETDDAGNRHIGTINFDKFYVGNQLADLYHFTRKIVEKNHYSFQILSNILERYGRICPLSEGDIEYIFILYSYPEKFYKLSNQYINSPKNWISPKMMEKLNRMIEDEGDKEALLNELNLHKSRLKSK